MCLDMRKDHAIRCAEYSQQRDEDHTSLWLT
jgi:hypothetical protein